MSMISRGIRTVYTSTILRKVVHVIFSLFLMIFFTQAYRGLVAYVWTSAPDPTLISLAFLLFCSAMINSIQIRMPSLRDRFLRFSADVRKKLIEGLEGTIKGKPYSEVFENLLKSFAKYEEKFLDFVSAVERDYELRFGYIGITFALLSITMSYVLFGYRAVYGVLALSVVDSLSSIITLYTQRRRRLKHSDISIAMTFAVFALILYPFTQSPILSIILSATAVLVELVSPEDNLTLPIATSFASYIVGAPSPMI